jgi:hypothetical protein
LGPNWLSSPSVISSHPMSHPSHNKIWNHNRDSPSKWNDARAVFFSLGVPWNLKNCSTQQIQIVGSSSQLNHGKSNLTCQCLISCLSFFLHNLSFPLSSLGLFLVNILPYNICWLDKTQEKIVGCFEWARKSQIQDMYDT